LLPAQQPGPNTAPQSGQPIGEFGHDPLFVPGGGPSHAMSFFVKPDRQSKVHAPFEHVTYPFAGAVMVHGSQPVMPQPTFGDGAAQTPPHIFWVAVHIIGSLVAPPMLTVAPAAPGAPPAPGVPPAPRGGGNPGREPPVPAGACPALPLVAPLPWRPPFPAGGGGGVT
jgi:hypothetical protein